MREHKNELNKMMADCVETRSSSRCNKDLGERSNLRLMSRGHQFVVRAGGHIDSWTPLYQSESLGQVFLFIISWLYLTLHKMPVEMWKGVFLAYDNMCQLARLRAGRNPLPLPAPFDRMWLKINKVIDSLHLRNHKDPKCHTKFNPSSIFDVHPDLQHKNTQAGEQTFVWLGRFKRIVCSMPKTHHMFFIHRQVVRRNRYSAKCYQHGRKPVLPGKRSC